MVHEEVFNARLGVATQLGSIAEVMGAHPRYRKFQFAAVNLFLMPALLLEQTKCFYSFGGRPVAFITWAFVNAATEARLIEDANYILHPSEWLEGDRLIIMDFCCTQEVLFRDVYKLLRQRFAEQQFGSDIRSVRSIRRDDAGKLLKVVTWFDRERAQRLSAVARPATVLPAEVV